MSTNLKGSNYAAKIMGKIKVNYQG